MLKRRIRNYLIAILLTGIAIQIPSPYSQIIPFSDYPYDPSDERIINAAEYLYSHQDGNGEIKGLSVSSWAAMALSLVDRNDSRFLKLTHYLVTSTSLLDFEKATDVERHILTLVACDINPENINSINLTEKLLDLYDGNQIGDPANIYDDIFGIIALTSVGFSQKSPIISQLKETVISKQQNDGSWGDVDTTAIAIMALACAGLKKQSIVFEESILFLKSQQVQSGGFSSWGTANSASTSWAVSALNSLGLDSTSEDWMQNKSTPITYLLSLQRSDGSFNYTSTQLTNPEWMTAYALITLCGSTLPVRVQERNTTNDPNPSDDDKDNNHDSSNKTNPIIGENTSSYQTEYEGISLLHPHSQGFYFMNRKTRWYLDSLMVIGPIDLTVHITESVDKVEFYLNDIYIGEDYDPPYSITMNQGASARKNTLLIQAIKYNQSFYHVNIDTFIPQIIEDMRSYLCEQNKTCYQNLSKLICEMDQHHIDKIYQTEISLFVISMSMLSKMMLLDAL
jgi:hypothetical protein